MGAEGAETATPAAAPDVADSTAAPSPASTAALPPSPVRGLAEAAESAPPLSALAGAAAAAHDELDLSNEELQAAIDASIEREYRTKRVRLQGPDGVTREVTIVLQNENGPCPLLAIANALALRGTLTLPASGPPRVGHGELTSMVAAAILGDAPGAPPAAADPNREQNVADAMAVLPKLATGLDVNVRFTAVDAFEFTGEIAIFDLLRLPLVHGWLVDPSDAATVAAVGAMSYNELVEKLCGAPPPPQQLLLEAFLRDTASQLTPAGLAALQRRLGDDTLAVFFRNNHFSTAYKDKGRFFLLVTDEGYRAEADLVWEELSNVGGDTPFLTGSFEPYVPKPPPEVRNGDALGALTDAAAVAAASGGGAEPDEATKALLRQLQEEEDFAAAQKLSFELEARRSGAAAGAVAHAEPAGGERDTAASRPAGGASFPGEPLGRALFAAIEQNDSEGLQIALASGLDYNVRDFLGRTPLHWAASNGQHELVSLLACNGAALNLVDDNGHTPLHLAALNGSVAVCVELLDARAAPDVVAQDGKTPAQAAQTPAARQAIESHRTFLEAAQRTAARAAVAQVSSPRQQQRVGRRDTDMAEADGSENSGGSSFFQNIKNWLN